MSWIEKMKKCYTMKFKKKCTWMKSIVFSFFVDSKKNIMKINKESADLEVNSKENYSTLSKMLLNMIQNQKKTTIIYYFHINTHLVTYLIIITMMLYITLKMTKISKHL